MFEKKFEGLNKLFILPENWVFKKTLVSLTEFLGIAFYSHANSKTRSATIGTLEKYWSKVDFSLLQLTTLQLRSKKTTLGLLYKHRCKLRTSFPFFEFWVGAKNWCLVFRKNLVLTSDSDLKTNFWRVYCKNIVLIYTSLRLNFLTFFRNKVIF